MDRYTFEIQRFANVIHGDSSQNKLVNTDDSTQIYGLGGNDTLESVNRKNAILIGGSGDDVLNMTGGTGTLSGGDGADTFNLNYSASATLSAVIEDIEPDKDKINITFDGNSAPELSYSISGGNVIWYDAEGYFNVTLKSYSSSSDFYDDDCHEYIWDVFWLVNQERERQGLSQLVLSDGLNDAASIRAVEQYTLFGHTRPDGTSCFTAIEKAYSGGGENCAVGYVSPEHVMQGWMNSDGHRANILRDYFKFIGIGYHYEENSTGHKDHWVQMFGGSFGDGTSLTAEEILETSITSKIGSLPSESDSREIFIGNTYVGNSGTYKIADDFSGTIRIGTNDAVTIDGTSADNLTDMKILAYSETANFFVNSGGGNNNIIVERASLHNGDVSSWQSKNYNSVTIDGGTGDDSIDNRIFYTSISGGAGNDTVINNASNVTIDGGAGAENIKNYNDAVEIFGEADNDIIINGEFFARGGVSVKLYGGVGADTISNSGSNSTLDGGAGNDLIRNGNYYFEPWNANYGSSYNGEHDDSLKSANTKIFGGAGNDSIHNSGATSTIDGGAGNDEIYNEGDAATISGGAGNDTVYNRDTAFNVTISGGDGDDSINNRGYKNILISGGSGNDTIHSGFQNGDTSENITIDGGAGDDSINSHGYYKYEGENSLVYTPVKNVLLIGGDGNDYIASDYNDNATINGGNGSDSIYNRSDEATIYAGKGNDSIYNSADSIVYLYSDGDGDDTVTGYDASDTIQISGSYSTQTSGSSDVLIKVSSGSILLRNAQGKTLNIVTVKGGEPNTDTDTIPAGISVSGATLTASTAFTGSEINLADFDSAVTKVNASALSRGISIVGSSAANSLKGGKGSDTISGGAGNDTVSLGGGNDVYIYSGGNDLLQDYKTDEDKIKLASGSISGASVSGSNVVLKIGSGNITVKGAKNKNITVIDSAGKETSQVYPSESLPAGISIKGEILTATAKFTGDKIDVANYSGVTKVNASALSRGISIVGSSAANSLKGGKGADTISGGAGNDTVSLGGGADVYIYSGGNDLIQDYKTGEDKIKLASGSISSASVSGSNVVLKIGSGNITVKGAKDKNITVIDSKGKETSNVYPLETLPAGLSYDTSKKILTVGTSYGGAAIDLVDFASTTKTVDASAFSKKIKITGNNLGNTILGGKGADTLSGGSKADSISGGAGTDKLFGGAGNDTLTGGAGNDSISGDTGTDKLFGDAGNDTLSGGAGNDTLTGGDGKDVFVYGNGDGKDIIADYTAAQDKIKISSGSISSTSYSGNNVVFKIGSGTLTVQNGKGKKITITDASGKTSTQTYSGAVSGTSKLFVDDNFISNETNLDAITEKNFAVTNFSATEIETVAQEETFIVSAEK